MNSMVLKFFVFKEGVEIAEEAVDKNLEEGGEVDKMDDGTQTENNKADEGEVEEREDDKTEESEAEESDDDKEKVTMRERSPHSMRKLVMDELISKDREDKAVNEEVMEEKVVGSVEDMEEQVQREVATEGVKVLRPNYVDDSEEVESVEDENNRDNEAEAVQTEEDEGIVADIK